MAECVRYHSISGRPSVGRRHEFGGCTADNELAAFVECQKLPRTKLVDAEDLFEGLNGSCFTPLVPKQPAEW